MKKLLYILALLIIVSQLAEAQRFVRQNPYPILSNLEDIYMDESGFGWAVGSDGTIMHTVDKGQNWEIQESPNPDWNFSDVEYLPGTNGMTAYIAGDVLLKTTDGGETWLEEDTGFNPRGVPYMRIFNENEILLISSNNVVRSFDGGMSWTMNGGPSAGIQKMSFVDINTGWVLAPAGDMNYTADGGANWEFKVNREIFNSTLGTFHFHSVDKGWMTTNNGSIYLTTDQGTSWDSISNVRFTNNWRQILSRDGNKLYSITGNLMHTSDDGGYSWTRIQSAIDPPSTYMGGLFLGNNDVWLVGNFTTILYSNDDTDSWVDQIAGSKGDIRDADAHSDTHLATAGDGGMLYTKNGGALWELFPMPNEKAGYSVHMIDDQTILVGGVGWIYKTEDGGQSWIQTSSISNTFSQIGETSSGRIIACGVRKNTVYVSDDQGDSWTTVYTDETRAGQIRDMAIVNESIYIVAYQGLMIKSSDNGNSWTEISLPGDDPEINLFNTFFFDEDHGIIKGAGDYYYRTRDGGNTWQPVNPETSNSIGYLFFDDELNGFTSAGSFNGTGSLYSTEDGGINWTQIHETPTSISRVLRPRSGDDSKLWVFGRGGNIELFAPCTDDPSITNLQVNDEYCQGDTAVLSVDFSNALEFFWDIPGDWFIEGNSNSSAITCIVGSEGGKISVRASNTCIDTEELNNVVEVSTPIASVNIDVNGNKLSTTTDGDRYQWYLNGEIIDGATSRTHTALENGNYTVGVTADPCGQVLSTSRFVTLSSSEEIKDSDLKIWPNPSNGIVNISSDKLSLESILITDLQGRVVAKLRGNSINKMEVSHLNTGVYLVRVSAGDQSSMTRLVVNE